MLYIFAMCEHNLFSLILVVLLLCLDRYYSNIFQWEIHVVFQALALLYGVMSWTHSHTGGCNMYIVWLYVGLSFHLIFFLSLCSQWLSHFLWKEFDIMVHAHARYFWYDTLIFWRNWLHFVIMLIWSFSSPLNWVVNCRNVASAFLLMMMGLN